MKAIRTLSVIAWLSVGVALESAPLILKIKNDTDFGLLIRSHSDSSGCSLHGKSIIIAPRSTFNNEFLLELGKPSLVLRPVFYQYPETSEVAWLTDASYEYQPEMIKNAYQLWKKQKISGRFKKDDQRWLHQWIGLDMSIIPNQVEMLGYLINLSRIEIFNHRHRQVQWLSFSKGIFAKLMLELHVTQSSRKGLLGKIVVLHGEGGICSDGIIERL